MSAADRIFPRRWHGALLALLLLVQWGAGPAQALALAGLQLDIDASICLAPATGPGHPAVPDHGAPWADQLVPACHALDHIALTPPADGVLQPLRWVFLPASIFPATEGPAAPRAPPLQPRAPPALA